MTASQLRLLLMTSQLQRLKKLNHLLRMLRKTSSHHQLLKRLHHSQQPPQTTASHHLLCQRKCRRRLSCHQQRSSQHNIRKNRWKFRHLLSLMKSHHRQHSPRKRPQQTTLHNRPRRSRQDCQTRLQYLQHVQHQSQQRTPATSTTTATLFPEQRRSSLRQACPRPLQRCTLWSARHRPHHLQHLHPHPHQSCWIAASAAARRSTTGTPRPRRPSWTAATSCAPSAWQPAHQPRQPSPAVRVAARCRTPRALHHHRRRRHHSHSRTTDRRPRHPHRHSSPAVWSSTRRC